MQCLFRPEKVRIDAISYDFFFLDGVIAERRRRPRQQAPVPRPCVKPLKEGSSTPTPTGPCGAARDRGNDRKQRQLDKTRTSKNGNSVYSVKGQPVIHSAKNLWTCQSLAKICGQDACPQNFHLYREEQRPISELSRSFNSPSLEADSHPRICAQSTSS